MELAPVPRRCAHRTSRASRTAADGRPEAVDDLTRLLFPDAVPTLPDAMHLDGERIDLAYAVGVLMGNRDLERRLRAEARGHLITAV